MRARRGCSIKKGALVPRMIDRMDPRYLAEALVRGARAELDLTPKPGLVDRKDNGSHPDLDHARMLRSIELLPRYYEELITLRTGEGRPRARTARPANEGREPASSLAACIDCGRRAEARMMASIGANTHRGYIFLSGLVLLAACDLAGEDWPDAQGAESSEAALRAAVIAVAHEFFADAGSAVSERPGSRARAAHGLGGVRDEALRGLPSVFEAGLPAYRAALDLGVAGTLAAYGALAAMMQVVEDTTTVQRCGLAGLSRIRRDGAVLQSILDRGEDPRRTLAAWNDEYRAMRLTMGGVADCLALVMAFGGHRQGHIPSRG